MTIETRPTPVVRMFKAGRFWSSNVFGAALGGAGAGVIMLAIMGIIVSANPEPKAVLFAPVVVAILVASVLCLLLGNWIAAFPYAVAIEEGTGLYLYAPLKKLYIPVGDIRDVQQSFFQQGFVVRLNRRHRLLKGFIIHSFFGDQAEPLALAIKDQILRRNSGQGGSF